MLTPKQRRFVAEYLKDQNGTQAAIRAGYAENSANEQAARLLAKDSVRKIVDSKLEKIESNVILTINRILEEIGRLALVDVGQAYSPNGKLLPFDQMPEDVRRCIAGVETEELYEGFGKERKRVGDTVKIKFWDKTKALEMAGRYRKMFTDKIEHDVSKSLEKILSEASSSDGDK